MNQMPQLAREAAVESHALLETAVSQLGTGENEIDYWRNGVNINVITFLPQANSIQCNFYTAK